MTDFVIGSMLAPRLDTAGPVLPVVTPVGVTLAFLCCPMPGRGPRMLQGRDPWRGFRFATRRVVMERAGGRCEGALFFAWGRCRAAATDVDHVYPWSRGGPTVVGNGQALCRDHNRRKSNVRPPWWYVRALERRRTGYVPGGAEARVSARLDAAGMAALRARRGHRG